MGFRAQQKYQVLGASAVAVSGAADTNENTLATITIPAGAMGLNGLLRLTATWSYSNNANNKTIRVRFSGAAGTVIFGPTRTTQLSQHVVLTVANRNSASSQTFGGVSGNGSSTGDGVTQGTATIDTSAATTLVITGQKATAGDTLTLESYLVELILP